MGCVVLFAVFYFLIPENSLAWDAIRARVNEIDNTFSISSYFAALADSSLVMIGRIFTLSNLATWQFWVFIYLSICVAANIRLSLADIKGSLSGFGCVVLLFLLMNAIGLATGYGTDKYFPFTASSLGVLYSLFILKFMLKCKLYQGTYHHTRASAVSDKMNTLGICLLSQILEEEPKIPCRVFRCL